MTRQKGGREAFDRLLHWDKGQTDAERLALQLLTIEGFTEMSPSHPRGGPDGGKDGTCKRDNLKWLVAVYFARDNQPFSRIKSKFLSDSKGLERNRLEALVFVVNQELTIGERSKLAASLPDKTIEIYHLEKIAHVLNSPLGFATRLEFLDIAFTNEEFVSYLEAKDKRLVSVLKNFSKLEKQSSEPTQDSSLNQVEPNFNSGKKPDALHCRLVFALKIQREFFLFVTALSDLRHAARELLQGVERDSSSNTQHLRYYFCDIFGSANVYILTANKVPNLDQYLKSLDLADSYAKVIEAAQKWCLNGDDDMPKFRDSAWFKKSEWMGQTG